MEYIKNLLGMTGGKRRSKHTRSRKGKRGGASGACESGEACAAQFSADSSLTQGETFAKMTAAYHGGRRTRAHKHRQAGGAADLSQAFEAMPAEMHQQAGTAVLDQAIADLSKFAPQTGGGRRRQRGGSASLADAFQAPAVDLHEKSGTSVLDAAFAQLSKFVPNHNGGGHAGGKRSRKGKGRRGGALGSSPVDAPGMLLRSEDYEAAYLSPQWTQENLVNPNFHGPDSAYMATTGGKRRSTYRKGKAHRKGKSRKAHRKSRKGRKASRRSSRRH